MFARPAFTRRLLQHVLVVGAIAAAVLVAASGTALAQTPPNSDQGPRFNGWGPGQAPPAAEGPTGGEAAPRGGVQGDPRPNVSGAPSTAPGDPRPNVSAAPGPYAAPAPARSEERR